MSGAKDAANHLYNTHATSLAMVVDPSQRLECYTILGILFLRLFQESWQRGLTDMDSTIHLKVVAMGLGLSAWHTGTAQPHQSRQEKGKRCQSLCL